MLKELTTVTKALKKSSTFLGGVALGSVGLKLLASKEAKKTYSKVVATSFKLKDGIDATVSTVKQHADDVVQDAQAIYQEEKKAAQLLEIEEA